MPNVIIRYLAHDALGYIIYLHDVGLSALLVSTYRAMREPRYVERAEDWLHVFLYIYTHI